MSISERNKTSSSSSKALKVKSENVVNSSVECECFVSEC